MSFIVVIPARHGSTRLPGKPLADIGGRPMVVRVAERAAASSAAAVWIATDHADVFAAAEAYGHRVVLTRDDHASGTDRLAEVVDVLGCDDAQIIVNVQGDEPLIDPAIIDRVADALAASPDAAIATACHPIRDAEEFFNPNVVKVVADAAGYALYFSRAPIPYARDAFSQSKLRMPADLQALRHVGLYAYRAGFLRRFSSLKPSPQETAEALEQLRALWHGCRVRLLVLETAPVAGVDTQADLVRIRKKFDESGD